MKKVFTILLCVLLLSSAAVFTITVNANSSSYEINKDIAEIGTEFSVPISIKNNTGIISLRFKIIFDEDVLELVSIKDVGLLKGYTSPAPDMKSPYTLRWADSLATVNNESNGEIAVVTFKVKNNVQIKETTVTIEHTEARTTDGANVSFADVDKKIELTDKHLFTSYVSDANATCTANGTKTALCDYGCGCKDTIEDIGTAYGHSYMNACDNSCDNCGEMRTITHNYEAATCTKAKTCKVCGVTSGSKLGHTYTNNCDKSCNRCGATRTITHSYAAATCTKAKTCKVCGATSGSKLGHTYTNNCDKSCNRCGATRSITHSYAAATCTKAKTCKVCGATSGKANGHKYTNACDTSCNTCKATRKITHAYKDVITKATLTKSGKIVNKCSVCGAVKSTKTIAYAKTFKLSATSYTYDGKVKTPTVTVKDSAGKTLKKGTDYTVTYASGRKSVGAYKVTITMKGNYTGTKTLTFNILPGKTSKLTATQTTTTLKASWNKVTGATGYKVELLNSSGKVVKSATTTKLTYTFSKLTAGTNYKVKVTAYKTISGKNQYSAVSTTLATATKVATPTLKVTSTKKGTANLSWTNVAGENGYQVYYSTSKSSGFKSLASYKTNVAKGSKSKLTSKKTYYFKVRSFKKVGSTTIYGDWSKVVSVKIK